MDDDLIALVVSDAGEHMSKAVEHTQAEFSAIRTGRATPALVEHLKVDYYGTETELRQVNALYRILARDGQILRSLGVTPTADGK